ncbi:hypothetical protein K466DRAFT_587635 [Polyporus arcularius HHB13444]|uniref:Uncharacterized protein n=1 Tax=Polyporus arcularius HHB13444 TaxID=1314778 RepID=A0A5C3PCN4_9APHY|nr:hypothetical protein K466DRAFT_587635 [Polyporus arcularius HHB13444]
MRRSRELQQSLLTGRPCACCSMKTRRQGRGPEYLATSAASMLQPISPDGDGREWMTCLP